MKAKAFLLTYLMVPLCLLFSNTMAQSTFTRIRFSGKWLPNVQFNTDHTMYSIYSNTGHNFPNVGQDLYFSKMDSAGNILFVKYFTGPFDDRPFDFLIDNTPGQEGIIIAGLSNSFSTASANQFYFIKTDFNGDTLWTKLQGGSSTSSGFILGGRIYSITKTLDNNYVATGPNGTCYVTKLNAVTGDSIYTRSFDNGNLMFGISVCPAADSGAYIAGGVLINNDADYLIMKLDVNGGIEWCKNYGDSLGSIISKISNTPDGGLVLTGDNDASTTSDIVVFKTNANGDTLWTRQLSYLNNEDHGKDIIATPDGGYILCGNSWHYINNNVDYVVGLTIKLDSLGNVEWAKKYQSTDCYKVLNSYDGGYLISGTYLIKTDSLGNSCSGININVTSKSWVCNTGTFTPFIKSGTFEAHAPTTGILEPDSTIDYCYGLGVNTINSKQNTINLFPNPVISVLHIETDTPVLEIEVVDLTGRVLMSIQEPAQTSKYVVNLPKLAGGMYLVKLKTTKGVVTKAFVKEEN